MRRRRSMVNWCRGLTPGGWKGGAIVDNNDVLSVLIVDDENWICHLIQEAVPWGKLRMEVVGFAGNGLEALGFLREKGADIVITDIRMPSVDGLELIRRAREERIDVGFIIVSGHRDFEYAKSAMSQGVAHYVLKPVDEDELTLALGRMRKEILARRYQTPPPQEPDAPAGGSSAPQSSKAVVLVKEYIYEHYREDLTLTDAAGRVHLNQNYLSSLFKKETGLTFVAYLQNYRIEQAKKLLRETTMRVSKLPAEVGYSDARHFAKLFKKITGLTPSEYRKLHI